MIVRSQDKVSLRKASRAAIVLGLAIGALASLGTAAGSGGALLVAKIDGSINPASADYLIHAIRRAEDERAGAILIELDTPGGLVSSTRDILQAILNAKVPVIVYVSPRGGWAMSAGTFITVASHVAAMAPGTTIGAAHPVSPFGGTPKPPDASDDPLGLPKIDAPEGDAEKKAAPKAAPPAGPARDHAMEKMENSLVAYMETIARQRGRNVEWVAEAIRSSVAIGEDEALELNVIDLIADDRRDLLAKIEGREVEVASGGSVTLALVGAPVVDVEMSLAQKIFDFVADPNIAVLLVFGGLLGLYWEFNSPGLIFPGVTGAVSLVLAAIAFQILPFSWVGLLLVLTGIGLLVAEIFVTSLGLLFAAGIVCFLLGGTMLFDQPGLNDLTVSFWGVLVPAVGAMAVFGGIVAFALGRALWTAQTQGVDELIGLVGKAATPLAPAGKVFVRGEYWNAEALSPVSQGQPVEITAVDGLRLTVRPIEIV